MAKATGVYPVYDNQFQVGADKASLGSIADMESYSVSFDNGVEEWTPMDTEGWIRRLMTSKGLTISVTGKEMLEILVMIMLPGKRLRMEEMQKELFSGHLRMVLQYYLKMQYTMLQH